MDPIVEFYNGGKDYKGRTLDEILSYSNEELEKKHDWVQVVFPNREASFFNKDAPLITDKTVEAFSISNNKHLHQNLDKALDRVREFYFGVRSDGKCDYSWISPGNHNYLRITRIINCFRELANNRHMNHFLQNAIDHFMCGQEDKSLDLTPVKFWIEAYQGKSTERESMLLKSSKKIVGIGKM